MPAQWRVGVSDPSVCGVGNGLEIYLFKNIHWTSIVCQAEAISWKLCSSGLCIGKVG